MPATINFLGGVALLVSGLTGPSIAVIPQLFQEAGWLTPLMAFGLVTILAGSAALFLVESMAAITGNENFQASIEYSTLAELFFGHRWHWVFQALLYVALQSQAITSLIESFQAMDTLLVTVAHKSCAISFKKGWECVSKVPTDAQGVFNDYIFISFGYLMTFVLVLPLGLIHLTDNIKFQIASFITLLFIVIVWVVTFCQVGIKNYPIPVVASNQGTVVGFVISNFAFVTTIPAFVNNVHPSTNIRRVIWLSLLISCSIYLVIGLTGASAFHTPQNSTILAVISDQRPSVIAVISVYAFPVAVLITSIPVFMIIIRYNLLRGNICSKPWAIFWSSILPWIVVIPFQTNGWLTIIMNWTSLVFSSVANLVIPFVLYLVSKRYKASAALDLHRDHDEFRIRPLETSSMHTPPVSIHHQPHSASSHVHFRASEDIHSSDFVGKLVSPYPAVVETVVPGEDNVIRIVRSPSIHRHYGSNGGSEG
ncbi:hypothetical protein BS47DRAFT_1315345 [Hydnum rufescens UP504]|uniref:Amino acid transporter transmembrane domain-containing protein n=1 Tax=Hydnum rufescens UP504 TaxID=1448309 RepID=A0A9P6DYZ9_9AGAM|nr:hypothetical protein BS47DRAFT_1315345 [Hydnum rufescens UP504]